MASSSNVAKLWAKAGLRNPSFSRQLKTRYDALLIQSIADGGLDKVTSATKNGVSMAKAVGLSVPEAMEAMQRAIDYIELGYVPAQSKALGRFF
jgi:hypothetical protein